MKIFILIFFLTEIFSLQKSEGQCPKCPPNDVPASDKLSYVAIYKFSRMLCNQILFALSFNNKHIII